jgi:hypothetical protein
VSPWVNNQRSLLLWNGCERFDAQLGDSRIDRRGAATIANDDAVSALGATQQPCDMTASGEDLRPMIQQSPKTRNSAKTGLLPPAATASHCAVAVGQTHGLIDFLSV